MLKIYTSFVEGQVNSKYRGLSQVVKYREFSSFTHFLSHILFLIDNAIQLKKGRLL